MSSEVTVRPFTVDLAEENLVDLRWVAATRWPDRETVTDHSEGVPLAGLRELVHYWRTNYDRRAVEARLNALPQFMTEIDGFDIHFIHVGSGHPDAPPLIMTRRWPGSIIELLTVIGPVTVFPSGIHRTPRNWAERCYRNLIYRHEVDRGSHFAAWEQPNLFAEELRAAFRPLR